MAKKKKKRTNPRRIPMSRAEIDKREKALQKWSAMTSFIVPLMALHDLYSFGPKRLEAVCDRMRQLYIDLDDGCFTPEEANTWLWEYAGIRLTEEE